MIQLTLIARRDSKKFFLHLLRFIHSNPPRTGHLNSSPGDFFAASKPGLLPMAISLVAWPSTSA
jgi:hypothetical protein